MCGIWREGVGVGGGKGQMRESREERGGWEGGEGRSRLSLSSLLLSSPVSSSCVGDNVGERGGGERGGVI